MPRRKPTIKDNGPSKIDVSVGALIKKRRAELGISQTNLADALKVSFQQIQKYERGTNRVSCSALVDIAKKLRVEPAYFFDGTKKPVKVTGLERELQELAKRYIKIKNPAARTKLRQMADVLAGE